MNVNSINAMYSVQNTGKTQSFKAAEKPPESKEYSKMNGLECLAAMLTPHKHFVEVAFGDKEFNLTTGIATIDDKEKEVISNLDVDMAEGKSKADIISAILKNATKIQDFSINLADGSKINVKESEDEPRTFETVLTKDGVSETIHKFGFGKGLEMNKLESYKKAISYAMNSYEQDNITSVSVSTLR